MYTYTYVYRFIYMYTVDILVFLMKNQVGLHHYVSDSHWAHATLIYRQPVNVLAKAYL